jgi:hypothetical protein
MKSSYRWLPYAGWSKWQNRPPSGSHAWWSGFFYARDITGVRPIKNVEGTPDERYDGNKISLIAASQATEDETILK